MGRDVGLGGGKKLRHLALVEPDAAVPREERNVAFPVFGGVDDDSVLRRLVHVTPSKISFGTSSVSCFPSMANVWMILPYYTALPRDVNTGDPHSLLFSPLRSYTQYLTV